MSTAHIICFLTVCGIVPHRLFSYAAKVVKSIHIGLCICPEHPDAVTQPRSPSSRHSSPHAGMTASMPHGFLISATIMCVAMSKNTILALAFCPMSRMARSIIPEISSTLASLMNLAKFLAKFSSSPVM